MRDSVLSRNQKAFLSIAPEESFQKVTQVFLTRNTHRTLGQTTSDTEAASDVCSVVRRNSNYASEHPTL